MNWARLFERADTYETTVPEIRETLTEHRTHEESDA